MVIDDIFSREWNVTRIPGTPVRTPARLRLELIPGREFARPSYGRRDACATASRIEDRWYALGGWLQRSEINLQFKSVGVRARESSDCRAARSRRSFRWTWIGSITRAMSSARDRESFDARISKLASFVRDLRFLTRERFIDDGIPIVYGRAASKWEPFGRYRQFY